MAHKFDIITGELKTQMSEIVYQFEPERISCDGELSRKAVDTKAESLSKRWWILVDEALSLHKINVDYDEYEAYVHSQPVNNPFLK